MRFIKFAGRGTALPETAIVISFVLVMVFGTIQMGIVGALQLASDGAASVAAHEYALNYAKSTTANQQTVTSIFPQVNVLPIAIASNPPNVQPSDVSVTYPTTQSARQGGTSLIRPSNLQATVDSTGSAGALGQFLAGMTRFGVHGSAIEPLSWQSNPQYDVADTGYTTLTPVQSAFFGSAQDVPFSYVSVGRMSICLAGGALGVQPTFGTTCNSADQQIIALGSAEFLDQDNWGRSLLGAGPFGSNSGGGNGYPNAYTFSEMFCHQQVYAGLESMLVNAARPSDIYQPTGYLLATPPPFLIGSQNTFDIVNQHGGNGDANIALIHLYQWDTRAVVAKESDNSGSTIMPYTSSNQYETGADQMHPGQNCS